MGDNDSLHTVGPKKLLDPSQGTWKRLGPSKQIVDTNNTCLTSSGPKRKFGNVSIMHGMHDITLDKKQKLDEEVKFIGKIMADNMGSAMAAWQYRRVQ